MLFGFLGGPSADQIQSIVIAQVTVLAQQATPYPTYAPLTIQTPASTIAIKVHVTVLAEVTRIVIVTPTATQTSKSAATPELPQH